MPKLTIDGIEVEVAQGTSILQACEQIGIEIPRFCFHDKLSVVASCRMCLVEVEKMPKPVPSCAQPCADGMVVHTNSPAVKKARKGVMELLLINHPLDCPICDQGGECDLQDQAVAYGRSCGRYRDEKRAVPEKDFGPLIKTAMTRCIHCTRCVRFLNEICGTPELGGMKRGENLEIGMYAEHALTSELSGNLIDICPVGALTNKPNAFAARSWEYQKTETVDVMDAVGSNIRVDTIGNVARRILPRLNEDVNEEWISDKTRFAVDGLRYGRLDKPWVKRDGALVPASWDEAFSVIADRLRDVPAGRVGALAGDLADCESMFALKMLLTGLGSPNLDCRQDGALYDVSSRGAYIMNSGISGIEEADAILLIGTNPRHEAALINARIRKRWLRGGCRVGVIGPEVDPGYPYTYISASPGAIPAILDGREAFASVLKDAQRPMFIVGAGALARPDGAAIHRYVRELAESFNAVREDWNGFNVLQHAAARVGGLDLGFLPQESGWGTRDILNGRLEFLWLLGADEVDLSNIGGAFVVYQGHHGDAGARRADVILPGAAYTEKMGLYVNTEGRPQLALQAAFPPGEAREDWAIVRAVSDACGATLPFDTLMQLREAMFEYAPVLECAGQVQKTLWESFGGDGRLSHDPFGLAVPNFYMTNPICRASPTMAKCSEEILPLLRREGTE
ncbi:MAG: NADH-quinone oxidoreductase subunit NuoG [Alphaproteobacteria bacterium]|nr:NADH-quinone oxidoreductase subunit NuoG [Alphaproteobacteria bacterium]